MGGDPNYLTNWELILQAASPQDGYISKKYPMIGSLMAMNPKKITTNPNHQPLVKP